MLSHLELTDFAIILAFGGSFFCIRKILTKTMFSSVSRLVKSRILKHSHKKGNLDEEDKQFHVKETLHAIENLWFTFFYPIFTTWGFLIAKSQPFFYSTDLLFKGLPQTEDFALNPQMKLYYLAEFGFYIQALFSLIFIDQRMKDFNEYLIHHVSTLISLAASYTGGFHRVGIMILLLHDVTDIFLYSSKFAVETGYRPIAAPLFAMFMINYTFLRLMYFPYLIFQMAFNKYALEFPSNQYFFRVISKASESFSKFSRLIDFDNSGVCLKFSNFVLCIATYRITLFCLLALVGLHVFWYRLALKVLVRSFGKDPKVYDIRKEGVED